jgi:hypothetical protein
MLLEAAAFALRRKGLLYLIRSFVTYVVIPKWYDFLMGRNRDFFWMHSLLRVARLTTIFDTPMSGQ